jgi:hypothetical protein
VPGTVPPGRGAYTNGAWVETSSPTAVPTGTPSILPTRSEDQLRTTCYPGEIRACLLGRLPAEEACDEGSGTFLPCKPVPKATLSPTPNPTTPAPTGVPSLCSPQQQRRCKCVSGEEGLQPCSRTSFEFLICACTRPPTHELDAAPIEFGTSWRNVAATSRAAPQSLLAWPQTAAQAALLLGFIIAG